MSFYRGVNQEYLLFLKKQSPFSPLLHFPIVLADILRGDCNPNNTFLEYWSDDPLVIMHNPVRDVLQALCRCESPQRGQLRIYTLEGQEVYNRRLSPDNLGACRFDIRFADDVALWTANGIYFLELRADGRVVRKKVVYCGK